MTDFEYLVEVCRVYTKIKTYILKLSQLEGYYFNTLNMPSLLIYSNTTEAIKANKNTDLDTIVINLSVKLDLNDINSKILYYFRINCCPETITENTSDVSWQKQIEKWGRKMYEIEKSRTK